MMKRVSLCSLKTSLVGGRGRHWPRRCARSSVANGEALSSDEVKHDQTESERIQSNSTQNCLKDKSKSKINILKKIKQKWHKQKRKRSDGRSRSDSFSGYSQISQSDVCDQRLVSKQSRLKTSRSGFRNVVCPISSQIPCTRRDSSTSAYGKENGEHSLCEKVYFSGQNPNSDISSETGEECKCYVSSNIKNKQTREIFGEISNTLEGSSLDTTCNINNSTSDSALVSVCPSQEFAKHVQQPEISESYSNKDKTDDAVLSCSLPKCNDIVISKVPSNVVLCDPLNDAPKAVSLTDELYKLSKCGWYWGPITRSETEDKLIDQPDGAFLVRDSSDDRHLLSLSFRSYGKTLHTRIEHSNGLFSFYSEHYATEGHTSVVELIKESMNYSQSGVFCYSRSRSPGSPSFPVRLTRPVSRFTQVRSLQYLCRFVIRQFTRFDHIQKLPLPARIKGYLEEGHY